MKTAPSPRLRLLSTIMCCAVIGSGCEAERPQEADRIEILTGDNQTGAPGSFVGQPLRVRVLGPRRVDFLGRKRERQPATGITVRFRVQGVKAADKTSPTAESEADSVGSQEKTSIEPYPLLFARDSQLTSSTVPPSQSPPGRSPGATELHVPTDEAGVAAVDVRLGTQSGEWRVEARVQRRPRKDDDVHFRVTSGVQSSLSALEGPVGSDVRFEMRLLTWDANTGKAVPLPDREVMLSIVDEPRGAAGTAELKNRRDETTNQGERRTEITLGDRPGQYRMLAEIAATDADERQWRGIVYTVVATDWLWIGVRFIAAVLVFVIGIRLLGSGTLLLVGGYSDRPTETWSKSRLSGFVGGAAAGVTFQSSSLVVSYLASLANSGLLRAPAALSLILGANVSATLLCQILALDVSLLAAPFLMVGTLFFVARRHSRFEAWAWVCVGLGLVLLSWNLLEDTYATAALSNNLRTALLADASSFGRFFVLLGTALGAGFLLRTSNLLVVLAMLAVAHELLPSDNAVPLVLGANLGAAVMVYVLVQRKRLEARRLALLNLLVHTLTCGLLVILGLIKVRGHSPLLWCIEAVVPGQLLSPLPGNTVQHVAMAHTLYNLFAAVLFLATPRLPIRLVDRLLPNIASDDELKPIHLDESLVSVPALALRQTTAEVTYLTEVTRKAVAEAFDAFRYDDLDLAHQVGRREELIFDLSRNVSRYLVLVGERQLSHRDATRLEILQSATEAVARIATYADALRDLTARKIDEKAHSSEEVGRDLNEVYDLVAAQFENILTLLKERDFRTEESAVKMVERLAKYSSRIDGHWRQRASGSGQQRAALPAPESSAGSAPEADAMVSFTDHVESLVHQEAFRLLFSIAADLAQIAQRMRILAPQRGE